MLKSNLSTMLKSSSLLLPFLHEMLNVIGAKLDFILFYHCPAIGCIYVMKIVDHAEWRVYVVNHDDKTETLPQIKER